MLEMGAAEVFAFRAERGLRGSIYLIPQFERAGVHLPHSAQQPVRRPCRREPLHPRRSPALEGEGVIGDLLDAQRAVAGGSKQVGNSSLYRARSLAHDDNT